MIDIWHIWILAGIALWIIEIFTTGFIVGIFGTACLVTSPFAAMGCPLSVQLVIFGATAAALSLGIRPLLLKCMAADIKTRTNADALIGTTCIVTEAIGCSPSIGRVKIRGEYWMAMTEGANRIEAGETAVVRKVEGCKVFVQLKSKPE